VPYFILPVLWILLVASGTILLSLRFTRAAGVALIVYATGIIWFSVLLSVVLPVCVILVTKPFYSEKLDFLPIIAWLVGFVSGSILGGLLAHKTHKKLQAKFPQLAPTPRNSASVG